jgi:hypothetical protein
VSQLRPLGRARPLPSLGLHVTAQGLLAQGAAWCLPSFAEHRRGVCACQSLNATCPPLPSPLRVFLALVEEVEDRGTVVAQGGGKVSWILNSLTLAIGL